MGPEYLPGAIRNYKELLRARNEPFPPEGEFILDDLITTVIPDPPIR